MTLPADVVVGGTAELGLSDGGEVIVVGGAMDVVGGRVLFTDPE